MTPDAPDNEELFTRLVAAYGDALAAGRGLDPDSDPNVPAPLRPRLRRVLDCLRQVHDAGPADDTPAPAASTGPDQVSLSATVANGATPPPSAFGLYGAAAGKRLGRFEVLRALGAGGEGVVFLAYDPLLARKVALKVPRLEALLSPALRERFLREARAAAGLDHPNLVPVYEAGEAGGLAYIASAYCPGSTLAAWLEKQTAPIPPDTAARLVLRLAEAVQYVHEHKIWHRDVKPSNVLLGPVPAAAGELPFTPRLTDFGLALLADRLNVTRSGMAGTPAYMAPEQTGGRVRDSGPHTDVYGLGAVLYEVLTKRPPFEGETPEEVVRKVQTEEPVAPRRLRKDVPRDLETICLKCLEKSPKKRYATAAELAGRLRLYLAGEPIPDRPPGRLERLWRAVRKRPLRSTAAALLGMALAGGLGAGYYFDPERPRREFAAALQSGRPYEFRGDERLPGPFRQVLGDAGPPQENRAEGCFSIETANISFWELMTDPTRERFRVSLEVRHDAAGGASLVGIYLGYRDSRTADGGRQGSFCTFTFADRGTEATIYEDNEGKPVSRALVRCCLFEEQAGRQPRISPAPTTRGVDFRPTFVIRGPAPWRKLAAEVTPEGTKTFWEGPDGVLRLAEGVPAEQLERHFHLMKDQRPRLAGVPTDYRPRAGIGLYVAQGKASFRHIVVRPTDGR